jgi:hypothetical protein
MDIETLKLILEAVDGATDKAVWIVIAIFARHYLTVLCGFGFGAFAIITVTRMIRHIVGQCTYTKRMAEMLGIPGFDADYDDHRKKLIVRIQTLLDLEKRDKTK